MLEEMLAIVMSGEAFFEKNEETGIELVLIFESEKVGFKEDVGPVLDLLYLFAGLLMLVFTKEDARGKSEALQWSEVLR